jgi:hypothetical protein
LIVSKTLTKACSVLKLHKNSLVLDSNKSNLFAVPLGNVESETPAKWLLDSGASIHFNNINDFVDYQVIKLIKVVTANRSTTVTGKGAVILTVEDKAIGIELVYHIPDLTTKLLSLGEFLHSGLHTRGSDRSISVEEGMENFLTFYPSKTNPNLYTVRALVYKEEALAKTVQCIYTVDFEVMHHRLAHPSKDVVQKARKHIKDFPNFHIPEECTFTQDAHKER